MVVQIRPVLDLCQYRSLPILSGSSHLLHHHGTASDGGQLCRRVGFCRYRGRRGHSVSNAQLLDDDGVKETRKGALALDWR